MIAFLILTGGAVASIALCLFLESVFFPEPENNWKKEFRLRLNDFLAECHTRLDLPESDFLENSLFSDFFKDLESRFNVVRDRAGLQPTVLPINGSYYSWIMENMAEIKEAIARGI